MNNYYLLLETIKKQFNFEPTRQQTELIDLLAQFCCMPTETKAFILKGYAGTGKTSIVSGLIMAMKALGQHTILLAPTGRAAKVLSNYSNHSAYSIHKVIYRQKSAGDFTFNLNYNSHKNTLFIIDEASMIANQSGSGVEFGSRRLLDDLVEYVYSGENCSMILVGDTAQLLPIGQSSSPALNKNIIEGYGLEVMEYQLTQVIRQAGESGILFNATKIRQAIENEPFTPIKLNPNFDDIKLVSGERADITVTFKVKKSDNAGVRDAIELGQKANVVEIASYATYYQDGKLAGKIDRDSAPANTNIEEYNLRAWYEDDTDSAPILNLIISGEERQIDGLAWEDKADTTLEYNQKVGNGVYDSGEALIGGLTTELVEKVMVRNPGSETEYTEYDFLWPTNRPLNILGGRTLESLTGFDSTTEYNSCLLSGLLQSETEKKFRLGCSFFVIPFCS